MLQLYSTNKISKDNYIKIIKFLLLIVMAVLLSSCGILSRLADVGKTPEVTKISNPLDNEDYRPVTMPMPEPSTEARRPNSLWRGGSKSFFKDLRASQIGDILTVGIEVADSANISNRSQRSRDNSDSTGISALFGLENPINSLLPDGSSVDPLVSTNSQLNNQGSGNIVRSETIQLKVAAVVTQLLPNGNLVIIGRQEFRVNNEIRELQIAGVIRPQDINSSNSITYEKIAEARVSYGGRGHITDVQAPRYGSQIADIILPF